MLCGASIAYGFIKGGYNAEQIMLEPLAKRIVQPTKEGDDLAAKREAILKPRVVGEFLREYNSAPLPRKEIALNVLLEKGVPRDRVETVYDLIVASAQSVGFFREIKGKQYVDLAGTNDEPVESNGAEQRSEPASPRLPILHDEAPTIAVAPAVVGQSATATVDNRRVFITHGKNKTFLDPIKRLLAFGELTPVISVEHQSVSKPVPDKVMDDMRSCSAAIIHVESEQILLDKDAQEQVVINSNVLIEIGAAMALFGRRFILLVKQGVQLPSNLQGLYEVRYDGETLDGDATIRLLEAINALKATPPPSRYSVAG
jgi:predicted nucleotide-binding protein